jgi:hypothetical protein
MWAKLKHQIPKPGLVTDTWVHYEHVVWLKTVRAKYAEYKKFKVGTHSPG